MVFQILAEGSYSYKFVKSNPLTAGIALDPPKVNTVLRFDDQTAATSVRLLASVAAWLDTIVAVFGSYTVKRFSVVFP
jgi:hypothetical protein